MNWLARFQTEMSSLHKGRLARLSRRMARSRYLDFQGQELNTLLKFIFFLSALWPESQKSEFCLYKLLICHYKMRNKWDPTLEKLFSFFCGLPKILEKFR